MPGKQPGQFANFNPDGGLDGGPSDPVNQFARLQVNDHSIIFCTDGAIDLGALSACVNMPHVHFIAMQPPHGKSVADCLLESKLVSELIFHMRGWKKDEEDCQKPHGYLCAQCAERRILRVEVTRLLLTFAPLSPEILEDLLRCV
jgi:hypothetical protein